MPAKGVREELWDPLVRIEGVQSPIDGLPSIFYSAKSPEVPLPKLFTLEWTEPSSTGNGPTHFPPTSRDLITDLEPQEKPSLYKAAVDAIRVANDYFVKSGCGSGPKGLNSFPDRRMLCDLADEFSTKYENEEGDFNEPPDLRILWVTDKNYHPSDSNIPWNSRLSVVACRRYHKLDDEEKVDLLRKTHSGQQQEYERSFSNVKIYNKFIVNIFMKYIAHLEHDKVVDSSGLDVQPTSAELDAFFAAPENAKGVTLYDLHRTFYQATDMEEFVKRVEVFATYVPYPPNNPKLKETPEGVYMRRKVPTVQQIASVLEKPTTFPQIFQDLASRYKVYADGLGSQVEVFDIVLKISTPDMTTGHLIRRIHHGVVNCPSFSDIRNLLRTEGPMSFADLGKSFSNRISSRELFEERLLAVAALDLTTGNYIATGKPQPNGHEIHKMLVKQAYQQPLSTEDVIRLFPDQVWNKKAFEKSLAEVAFIVPLHVDQDNPAGWLPLRTGGIINQEFLSEDDSRRLNGLEHLLRTDPKKLLEWVGKAAYWNGTTFVENPSAVQDTSKLNRQPNSSKFARAKSGSGPKLPAQFDSPPPPEVPDLTTSTTSPVPPPSSNKRKRDDVDGKGKDNVKTLGAQDNSPRSVKKTRLEKDGISEETVPSSADLPPSNPKAATSTSKALNTSPTKSLPNPEASPSVSAGLPASLFHPAIPPLNPKRKRASNDDEDDNGKTTGAHDSASRPIKKLRKRKGD